MIWNGKFWLAILLSHCVVEVSSLVASGVETKDLTIKEPMISKL